MVDVELRQLGVRYGNLQVLEEMDLDVPSSEFLVLLGPSGCGKSTLLNAIAGLQDVSSGTIRIGGHDMTRVEPKDRGIAMVFQSYALYPRMSVRGNLGFGLKVAGVPKAEIEIRVQAVAEMLQIADFLDRRPAELSGGQRQRVAIGRAVVREAGVFLFDEPLSNLDAQLRADLRVEIKRLHKRLKATMIYVTHDQVEAMTLADRIAVMKDKVIQQLGTPDDIYSRPANKFVARFVGSPAINFIDAKLFRAGRRNEAICDQDRIALGNISENVADGHALSLGIRPEHIELASDAAGLEGEVDVIEPLGSEKLVWFTYGAWALSAKTHASTPVEPGQPVRFRLPEEHIHVFDAKDGRRL